MDAIDRRILEHVQRRGRDTYAEIGAEVGLSVSAVNERLKKLQANGTITGWHARVDAKAVGRDVLAFMLVLLERPDHERKFVESVSALPDVLECHHVTGEWSYLLKLRLRVIGEVETALAETIKRIPHAVRTHTFFALSSAKDSSFVPCDGTPATGLRPRTRRPRSKPAE
jgi:Lrp/AsnC family transcriptional regulator, leucine-responsive regulatory protein